MIFLPVLLHLLINIPSTGKRNLQKNDPCEAAKAGAVAATVTAKDSIFQMALTNIKSAYNSDGKEHCISFGKDAGGHLTVSPISTGSVISSSVPKMANAFADLHNHPNNTPPDAGDFYSLSSINKTNSNYTTRFAVTLDGTIYALLVTDTAALHTFITQYAPQPPAFKGGPPGFPVAITDEAREMKYRQHCTDEMVLAFILEKYKTGISLLKQNSNGLFYKINTTVAKKGKDAIYVIEKCL